MLGIQREMDEGSVRPRECSVVAAVPRIVFLGVMRFVGEGNTENIAVEPSRPLKVRHTQGDENQSTVSHDIFDAVQRIAVQLQPPALTDAGERLSSMPRRYHTQEQPAGGC